MSNIGVARSLLGIKNIKCLKVCLFKTKTIRFYKIIKMTETQIILTDKSMK